MMDIESCTPPSPELLCEFSFSFMLDYVRGFLRWDGMCDGVWGRA